MTSEGQLGAGALIDHYRIVRRLGEGGFSEAYEAIDERTQARVVLKLPSLAIIGDPQTFERFRREMAIARRLDHPNVQRSLDVGENRSRPYLVLEYVEGETLRQSLRGRLPLSVDEAVGYGTQLAGALAHAHAHGIAHRDLKPENVLVTTDGQLKLFDFGIALMAGARRVTWRYLNDRLGTPDYMAPEQIEGKRGDQRTDVYALGVMLYEFLAGQVPFVGDNALAVMSQTVHDAPVPLHERNRAVPPPLEAVVHKAIRKAPEERYQSAEKMLHDLEHLDDIDLAQFVMGPERAGSMPSDRHILLVGGLIGAGFTLFIVLAVVITMLLEHR
ncbi:MAG: serine/threonine-protein kinase [Candidatus Dormibacteria bacterium]